MNEGHFRRLAHQHRRTNKLLLGAAVGTGMAARAAERGGADLLLALNAGKLRSMGAASIASLLPLRDSNRHVLDFAASEILGSVNVPVFFGASAFDPRQPLDALVGRIAVEGFAGIVNFPTSVFLSGSFRERIEAAGVGFARELELLRLAKQYGLLALGYAHTAPEARQLAHIGVDIINLNLGWNSGGSSGASSPISLVEAAEFVKLVVRGIRQVAPACVCMIEGGPIIEPDEMYEVVREADADGYIGGSTIDRIPLELSIEGITAAFKSVGVLRRRVDELERQMGHVQRNFGIIGNSDAAREVQRQVARLSAGRLPLLVSGPPGSGKEQAARAIHLAGGGSANTLVVVGGEDRTDERLFGVVQNTERAGKRLMLGRFDVGSDTTIYVKEVGKLSLAMQGRILDMIEKKNFQRVGDNAARVFEGRVLFGSSYDPAELLKQGSLHPRFVYLLRAGHIRVPALVERLDDLPLLVQFFIAAARNSGKTRANSIEGAALRALLAYGWPDNVRELRSVIERGTMAAKSELVCLTDLPALLDADVDTRPEDERSWILDALRKNHFRKTDTARYLGVSRKTLYNKMRQFDLPLGLRRGSGN